MERKECEHCGCLKNDDGKPCPICGHEDNSSREKVSDALGCLSLLMFGIVGLLTSIQEHWSWLSGLISIAALALAIFAAMYKSNFK